MMSNQITLCENAMDPASWTTHECGDVREFLVEHFRRWPDTARLYLNRVSKRTDVTPYDEAGVERLGRMKGHFIAVIYPAEAATIIAIIAVALSAVSVGLSFLLRPALPENQTAGSPTNSLTSRQNKERLGGRIPDIYGSLWVTPDLIALPYRIFIGNKEVEYTALCIGRGYYVIDEVRDDVTPLEEISGAGCEIYGPFTSPNSGDEPQLAIGEPVNEPIRNVKQYSSVNGQTLRAPNANKFKASKNIRFNDNGTVQTSGDVDFTDYFDAGTVSNPKYLIIGNSDYNGTYLILDVSATLITLSGPGSVNPAWNSISGSTSWSSPTLMNSADNFEGPYLVIDNTVTEIWANFIAPQGLYEVDSKGNQRAMSVTVQLEVTSIDNNYNPQGSPVYYQTTIRGSEVFRSLCGVTLVASLPIPGSCKIRARRLTNTDLRDGWSVVDHIQWRDLYGVAPLESGMTDFGNVTTMQTITWPTPQATSIKQRKINVKVKRHFTPVTPEGVDAAQYTDTANAAAILVEMALDPYLGRRVAGELDLEGIYSVLGIGGEVEAYFHCNYCSQFSFAFDDEKISFEEMVGILAQATFCSAYRVGSVLSVIFEKKTENSTTIFNHRNKIPKTESRTQKFGTASENDGIDLNYVEPNAPNAQNVDSQVTLHFPGELFPEISAVSAKKITAYGVRNRVQAWILGWRMYQKLLYQNLATQFDATQEASLTKRNERILIADNTRPDVQDGEIIGQNALELTLSQNVDLSLPGEYLIFLQIPDGTVESIPVSAPSPGDGSHNKVILAEAPSQALVFDNDKWAKTTYMIVHEDDAQVTAFLMQEKDPKDGGVFTVKAVNYDEKYYDHDQDYNASPKIVDVITPGIGTGTGYSKQASTVVFVDGKTMPWISPDNAAYPYGRNDGKPPVMVPIHLSAGSNISISTNTPGQAVSGFTWLTGKSNTVRRSSEGSWVDAEGEQDHITGDSGDSNGHFPTLYTTDKSLGRVGLAGCWAIKDSPTAGKYAVVEPFVIGFGGVFTVPAGGVNTLLLGINDNKFSDNQGGFQVLITQTGAAAGDAAAADPILDNTTTDPDSVSYIFTVNGS